MAKSVAVEKTIRHRRRVKVTALRKVAASKQQQVDFNYLDTASASIDILTYLLTYAPKDVLFRSTWGEIGSALIVSTAFQRFFSAAPRRAKPLRKAYFEILGLIDYLFVRKGTNFVIKRILRLGTVGKTKGCHKKWWTRILKIR